MVLIRGRSQKELYEAIGRLPELNPIMPPFEGSDQQRKDLAAYLENLPARAVIERIKRCSQSSYKQLFPILIQFRWQLRSGFLWTLLMLTFLLHIIPMNFVLGGSVIAFLGRYKGQADATSYPRRMAALIAGWMPVTVAATITFGVAPLLFIQVLYGRLLYTSSILMGWFWWLVIPILIIAYYTSYFLAFRENDNWKRLRLLAAFSSALFLVIGLIYTINMSLMLRPERFSSDLSF